MKFKFNEEQSKKLFFTSDTHWHHRNIIELCNRPWGDMQIHDGALIQSWNKVVPKDGIVFHAGDFAMTGQIDWIRELISKLNGTIYHVRGNHDYQNRWDRQVIVDIFEGRSVDIATIVIEDSTVPQGHTRFFISHYPHLFWERGAYHLHGHVHSGPYSTAKDIVPFHKMRYDIGVDNNDYYPISYDELMTIFKEYEKG